MKVTANDQAHEVEDGATVGDFIRGIGLDPRYVVVERNGEVVRRTEADATELAGGDRLIVVRAVAGGADPFPSLSAAGERRQARLRDARLYVVTDARRDRGDLEELLTRMTEASVDIVQLRDKTATEDELRAAADVFARVCDRTGALFVLNDFPGLAVQVGADGVHVGQEDVHPDHARTVVGPDLLIGRSTHSRAQIDAAADEDVDYFAVGPIHETPTKQGRPAIGLEPVRYATRHAAHPWFAIGGLSPQTVGEVLEAGARRIVVVRAVTQAEDPASVCWSLRRAVAPFHDE
ncbi:MAG TPA: thiamine phosphate synthase [Nitriliruptorales bacterium]